MMLRASEWASAWIFRRCAKEEGRLSLSTSNSNNSINYHFQNNRRKVTVCGFRSDKKKRPPSMVLSQESIQVIRYLKLAKSSDEKLNQVLKSRLRRLLSADALDVFSELHRQNELRLSLKVLEFIIGEDEVGYDKLLQLYADTILLLGRNKMVDMAEGVFSQVIKKGLKPDAGLFTELIGLYLQVCNTEKAMEVYRSMKASGCSPDKLTFTILIRNLQKNGEHELAESLKEESFRYVHEPHRFVQKVNLFRKSSKNMPKKRHVNLVKRHVNLVK